MRQLVRNHFRFFALATLAGTALRLLFIFRFPSITTDSFIYGDIAKNWLQHGVYGLSDAGRIVPTYIRLPGYPAFLAAVFAIFGMEHYRAVLFLQLAIDIGTCLVIADIARRVLSERASTAAFLLAALCPFLANYVATALTETLEVFFTAVALNCAVVASEAVERRRWWAACGLAIAAAILLRPDGGLLLVAVELYLIYRTLRSKSRTKVMTAIIVLAGISIAPLVPWTIRNLRTMHRFQPLAPRYANEENEFVPAGFNRWVRTWIADYASTEEIYWQVPGSEIDPDNLPSRAFDSDQQRQQTLQLISDYNDQLHVTPELDARFAQVAAERVRHSWLRYYLCLPALRIADMWLRPRTEMLPSDTRWWEFNDDPKWSALAIALGVINLAYVGLAFAGLVKGRFRYVGLLLTFVIIRSLFLGSLENPEPRYTLECYPVVILLAAAWFAGKTPGAKAPSQRMIIRHG